jgi:hypothetical protein
MGKYDRGGLCQTCGKIMLHHRCICFWQYKVVERPMNICPGCEHRPHQMQPCGVDMLDHPYLPPAPVALGVEEGRA